MEPLPTEDDILCMSILRSVLELYCTLHTRSENKFRSLLTKYNKGDAYQVATNRAESTKKRHRLVDDDGHLLDLIER